MEHGDTFKTCFYRGASTTTTGDHPDLCGARQLDGQFVHSLPVFTVHRHGDGDGILVTVESIPVVAEVFVLERTAHTVSAGFRSPEEFRLRTRTLADVGVRSIHVENAAYPESTF